MNVSTADSPRAPGGALLMLGAVPVVALSACFTFLLQPVVGKFLVPQVGGGAGVWVTTMCFFQTALFLGYGGAYLLRRRPLAVQGAIVAGLASAAWWLFRLPPPEVAVADGWWGIVASLGSSLLPAVVLSTGFGIILQGWLGALHGRVPFWLYGVSNAGSLLALLAYPFWIEPRVDLAVQALVLRTLLGVLAVSALLGALIAWRRGGGARVPEEGEEVLPPGRIAGWIGASALTCAWLIAGTNLLQAEIGSNPLAWVLPFALYLFGFSVAFVPSWPRGLQVLIAVAMIVAHVGFLLSRGVKYVGLLGAPAAWLLIALLAGCLYVHREIYLARPTRRYSQFYLAVAAGGMLAGLGCSLVLPNVLTRPVEFVACGAIASALAVVRLGGRLGRIGRWSLAGVILVGTAVVAGRQIQSVERGAAVRSLRNHYGTVVLRVTRERLTLMSESTIHGMQYLAPALQQQPASYYHEGTAFGRVMRGLQANRPALRVGVVGLGVGTAAAYLRREDSCVFWEINPLMVQAAGDAFSFLRGSAGKVSVELIDGRLGVARSAGGFDLLLLDAFSGDGVPAHLLTREAFQHYTEKARGGLLLCHISNQHMDLFPVIAGHARALGWKAFAVLSTPTDETKPGALTSTPARYAVLFPPARAEEVAAWFRETGPGPTRYQLLSEQETPVIEWSDGRHAVLDVLHLRGFTSGGTR